MFPTWALTRRLTLFPTTLSWTSWQNMDKTAVWWIENWLNSQVQRVEIGGTKSGCRQDTGGVVPRIGPGANTLPQSSSLTIQKMGQCRKFIDYTKLGETDTDTVVLPFKWTWRGWRIRLRVKSWSSAKLGKNDQCTSAFSPGRAPGSPAAVSQKCHLTFLACFTKRLCTQPFQNLVAIASHPC